MPMHRPRRSARRLNRVEFAPGARGLHFSTTAQNRYLIHFHHCPPLREVLSFVIAPPGEVRAFNFLRSNARNWDCPQKARKIIRALSGALRTC